MTREEYVAICQKCQLRKRDSHKGIVCSLTGEHADFVGTCANYSEDAQEVVRIQQEEQEHQASLEVSGWLAFFLWVGVGFGALASVVITLGALVNSGTSTLYNLLAMGEIGCLLAVAVMTIIAFYKRKENAVSLALTYIAMIALDGILSLAISVMTDDYTDLISTFRQFVWAGIWGTYIHSSVQVEELIPSAKRVWSKIEKTILGVYIVLDILIVIVLGCAPTAGVSDQKLMEVMVENMNTLYRDSPASEIYVVNTRIEDRELVYKTCINTVAKADCDEHHLAERSVVTKYNILSGTALEHDADSYEEMKVFLRNGYGMCWEYVDKNMAHLYSVHISPNEYVQAFEAGVAFKCPATVIDSMIGTYMEVLPMEYVGGCQLESIVYDDARNELTYTVRLPEMDNYTLLMDVNATYLTDYVHENWSAFEDNIVELAEINGATICERFLTYEGKEHAIVRISAEEYRN